MTIRSVFSCFANLIITGDYILYLNLVQPEYYVLIHILPENVLACRNITKKVSGYDATHLKIKIPKQKKWWRQKATTIPDKRRGI